MSANLQRVRSSEWVAHALRSGATLAGARSGEGLSVAHRRRARPDADRAGAEDGQGLPGSVLGSSCGTCAVVVTGEGNDHCVRVVRRCQSGGTCNSDCSKKRESRCTSWPPTCSRVRTSGCRGGCGAGDPGQLRGPPSAATGPDRWPHPDGRGGGRQHPDLARRRPRRRCHLGAGLRDSLLADQAAVQRTGHDVACGDVADPPAVGGSPAGFWWTGRAGGASAVAAEELGRGWARALSGG